MRTLLGGDRKGQARGRAGKELRTPHNRGNQGTKGERNMIVDKIYARYKYMGNWFVIARLTNGTEFYTRPVMMSEKRAKEIKEGDVL